MNLNKDFSKNVFINCPFDDQFIPLLRSILFVIIYLGFTPRIALERFDSGEARINKIIDLIKASKFSIHDLSRIKSSEKSEYFRLNMPFELGVDIGCKIFKDGQAKDKKCLILEKEKYRYQKALSDLSNSDIKNHNNEPEEVIRQIRDWFVVNELERADSGTIIWESFNEFMADFYLRRKEEGFREKDILRMPIPEFISFTNEWIIKRRNN
jgi:hypothetical protein